MWSNTGWRMASGAAPTARSMAGYGLLALPLAFGGLPLYVHAPDFYAADLGLPLAALGLTLAGLRLLDAGLDPLAGWLSDRWPRARLAWVVLGAAALALGVLALFLPPAGARLTWFAAAMALASLGHSLVSVNLLTLGGAWRPEAGLRARISAMREAFGLAGLVLAVVLPAALAPWIGRGPALAVMAGLLAVLLMFAVPVFARWYRRTRPAAEAMAAPAPIAWDRLRPFYLAVLPVLLSAALPAALILMLVRDLLGLPDLAGLFLLAYFLAALPGTLAAGWLAARWGAVPVWIAALILSMAAFAFCLRLGPGEGTEFLAICLLTGFCFGADLVLPPAILSARIEAAGARHAAARAFALLGFLTKAALALAGALALPLLQLAGFRPAQPNSPEALRLLLILYAALPLALRGLAVVLLFVNHRRGRI